MSKRLGVGFIGSGFNTRFHIQAWQGVRDADVLGVWSPNPKNAASAAQLARSLDVGAAKAYKSIGDMVADPAIDALWLCGPNQARIENVEEIVHAIKKGRGTLRGIACEKPLARNVAEAKEVMGDVDGRLCILNDDMIDSGGTIVSAAEVLMARGAKEVWAMATHAVLSGPAIERLQKSVISRVVQIGRAHV